MTNFPRATTPGPGPLICVSYCKPGLGDPLLTPVPSLDRTLPRDYEWGNGNGPCPGLRKGTNYKGYTLRAPRPETARNSTVLYASRAPAFGLWRGSASGEQRSTTDMCAAVARSSHSHGMIRVISECTTTHVDPINVRTALHSTTTVKTELIHRAPRAEPPTKASLSKPVQITIGPIGHAPRTLCALAARPTVGSVGEHPMCSPAAGRHPHPSPRLVRVKRTRSHTIAYEYDRPAPLPSRAPTHRPPTANG